MSTARQPAKPPALPPFDVQGTVGERTSALLSEVATLAASHGHPELTEGLTRQLAGDDDATCVVVVGETQRGKSTLVNALLDRPGLSPVGPDAATTCAVMFTGGSPEVAHAVLARRSATPDGPGVDISRRQVPLVEVADWITVDGQRQLDSGEGQTGCGIVSVEVRLDAPVLDRLTLVDTPGLNGLRRGQTAITLARLAEADALLFVLDASQPVLAPELDLLASALDRLGTILIVIAKADAQSSEQVGQLVAASQALLHRRDPRLGQIPLLPVSAWRAQLAAQLAAHRPAEAARLRGLSGLPALTDWLTGTVRGQATSLRRRAAVRNGLGVLAALRAAEDATPRALVDDTGLQAALAAEQERLQALVSDRSRSALRADVAHHLRRLQSDPQALFDERIRQLREDFRERAVSGPPASLDALPQDLQQDIAAASLDAGELFQSLVVSLGLAVAGRLRHDDAAAAVAQRYAGDLELPLTGPGSTVSPPGGTVFNMLGMVGLGGFAGNAAAALIGMSALVPTLVLLPAAAGLGWWRGRVTERSQRRQHLAQWVAQTCQESRALFATEVRRRLSSVQQYTEETLPGVLADRIAQLQSVAAQGRALAEAGQMARRQATTRHAHRSAQIARLQHGAQALLQELSGEDPPPEAERKGRAVC